MSDDKLERLLTRALQRSAATPQEHDAAVNRVLARLSDPLPRQKMPFWRLPPVLLDRQFAPAWPRMVALAGFAALGFFIGMAGLDRSIDPADAGFLGGSRAGLGAIAFEPEALTGARP
jgi:hypothetical protein